MHEHIQLNKIERNSTEVNGLIVAEFIESDMFGNRYQILHAINPETCKAIMRVNNLDEHRTLFNGYVYDVREIKGTKDIYDMGIISYEQTVVMAYDEEKDCDFYIIITALLEADENGDFYPDYDNAMISLSITHI